MDKDSLTRFVQQLMPMGPAKAAQIVSKFIPGKVARNAHVLKAGMVCKESVFVEAGIMRSYVYDLDGNEVTTAFYSKDSFAGDMLSFFKRTPTKEYLQAITDCETWRLSYEDMQDSFHTIPEFREFGRLHIVSNYAVLKERMLSVLQQTAEQRYSDLIESSPELFQNVPLKYIASYLGVTDTSLSRIRKEFVRK